MKERPILFSAPMVRALLAGTKTQTRRVMKNQPTEPPTVYQPSLTKSGSRPVTAAIWADQACICPYGVRGDHLWVRETWAVDAGLTQVRREHEDAMAGLGHGPYFRADLVHENSGLTWRPSIHLPRWASRINLELTRVRAEQVQTISEEDAIAEGCEARPFPGPWWQGYRDMGEGELMHQQMVGEQPPDWMIEPKLMQPAGHLDRSAVDMYRALWESLNGNRGFGWDNNPWVWVIEFRRLLQ